MLAGLRMVPMRTRKMGLEYAAAADARWLAAVLRQVSSRFATPAGCGPGGVLTISPSACGAPA
jgi:poly-gamma-glutamate synthesis protein (capsule biosynthesis protein)